MICENVPLSEHILISGFKKIDLFSTFQISSPFIFHLEGVIKLEGANLNPLKFLGSEKKGSEFGIFVLKC